jgi:glucose/arabinose dehydrogenase
MSQLAGSLVAPTAMVVAPDGRVFVAEQGGDIRVVDNGELEPTPFAHVHVTSTGDLGLLGITLDPDFSQNHFVYVFYAVGGPKLFDRVSRFTADGDVAEPGSEVTILNLDALDPSSSFDDGGAIHFGPDGKLYIAVGDDDNPENSQSLSNLEGKILRVNPDGSIPTDNPFYNRAHRRNRLIWCLGLRNPFNFSFDPNSGLMFINDVGSDLFEEVNQGAAGANYGWPIEEGPGSDPALTNPVYAYPHPQGFAITGSAFFPTASRVPAKYAGDYLFSDLYGPSEDGSKSVAWIRLLDPETDTVQTFASGLKFPIGLAFASDGSLYVLSRGTGTDPETQDATGSISVIRYVTNRAPAIDTQPVGQTVGVGEAVSFSVRAVGTGTMQYQWLRDGSDISGATSATLTIPAARLVDNDARYSVVVTDEYGSVTSSSARLNVVDAAPPKVRIVVPVSGALFAGGEAISFSADAVDGHDGVLHGDALAWRIQYQTGSNLQPFAEGIFGASGQFTPSIHPGTTSTDVAYVLTLTATDSLGLNSTVSTTIEPRIVELTVTSNIVGMPLGLDGAAAASPETIDAVVGVEQDISAGTQQAFKGVAYTFDEWSDGGAATHLVVAPAQDRTYTAEYSRST